MKDIRPRWRGYESVKWYWRTPDDRPVYIVWARDDKHLRRLLAPWLRWLPAPILWHILIWRMTR